MDRVTPLMNLSSAPATESRNSVKERTFSASDLGSANATKFTSGEGTVHTCGDRVDDCDISFQTLPSS